jgi:TM2 domain-containing membrane protein YozV
MFRCSAGREEMTESKTNATSPELAIEPHRALWLEANPWIAGVLAFLIPGAGHFYQGRWFKGTIYFFCILGTFLGGMKLGDGMVVYHKADTRLPTVWYATQLLTGAVALPAYFQGLRAAQPANRPLELSSISGTLTLPFEGELKAIGPGREGVGGPAKGTLTITSERTAFSYELGGRFVGTVGDRQVDLPLGGSRFLLAPQIGGGSGRAIEVSIGRNPNDHPDLQRLLIGSTPRSFMDSFEAPPDQQSLNDVYRRLGARYDMAVVFTLIAGLLNLFAIWDCVEGPAYGFGDEQPRPAPSAENAAATIATAATSANSATTSESRAAKPPQAVLKT